MADPLATLSHRSGTWGCVGWYSRWHAAGHVGLQGYCHHQSQPLTQAPGRPFFFFFLIKKSIYFGHAAQHVGSQFPEQGSNVHPLHWERWVSTKEPPGKSLLTILMSASLTWGCACRNLRMSELKRPDKSSSPRRGIWLFWPLLNWVLKSIWWTWFLTWKAGEHRPRSFYLHCILVFFFSLQCHIYIGVALCVQSL